MITQQVLLATVTQVVTGGVKLRFDGELSPRAKTYKVLGATPAVDARVAVAALSGTHVVLGGGGGGGDVVGPAGAADGRIALFDGVTGKLLKDSGILPSSLVTGPASAADARIAVFDGVTGKLLKDGGVTLADLSSASGWLAAEETWTYVSANEFTVNGDRRSKYTKGNPLKWTQNDNVRQNNISADPTYNAGTNKTHIKIHSGYVTTAGDSILLNAAITNNFYSVIKTPAGFPGVFAFAATATGFSGTPTVIASFEIDGAFCDYYCNPDGTSNATGLTVLLPVPASTSKLRYVFALIRDNGVFGDGIANTQAGDTNNLIVRKTGLTAFTNSGTKSALCSIKYPIA